VAFDFTGLAPASSERGFSDRRRWSRVNKRHSSRTDKKRHAIFMRFFVAKLRRRGDWGVERLRHSANMRLRDETLLSRDDGRRLRNHTRVKSHDAIASGRQHERVTDARSRKVVGRHAQRELLAHRAR